MSKRHKAEENIQSAGAYTAVTGFTGGVLWSGAGYLAYVMNFISFGPAFLLKPWALGNWKYGNAGELTAIILSGVLSIGLAFLYRILFARFDSIWPGIIYGLILWIVVFILLNPLFGQTQILKDINTTVTSIAVFVLYGLFIGYSLSYDFNERLTRPSQTIQD